MWYKDKVSSFFFLTYRYRIILTPYFDKTILPLLNCLCIFVKNKFSTYMYVSYQTFTQLCWSICLSLRWYHLYWLLQFYINPWNWVVILISFYIWNSICTPTLLLFWKIILAILGPMHSHVCFRISLWIALKTKKLSGIWIEFVLKTYLSLGKIGILTTH